MDLLVRLNCADEVKCVAPCNGKVRAGARDLACAKCVRWRVAYVDSIFGRMRASEVFKLAVAENNENAAERPAGAAFADGT